jgi:mRNA interferase MazF
MVGPSGGILQGDVWWADLADPPGSTARYRRPVIVIQGDAINQSRIETAICVPLTSNLKWADAPGNVLVRSAVSGLDRDSVAQVTLVLAVDKVYLSERVGRVPPTLLGAVLSGLDLVLGRAGR